MHFSSGTCPAEWYKTLRGQPLQVTQSLCEALDDSMRELLRRWLVAPWKQIIGASLCFRQAAEAWPPSLRVHATAARVAALATIPDMPELQACRGAVVRHEEEHLRHVLQPSLPIALEEEAGNILQMPAGKSTKQADAPGSSQECRQCVAKMR